MPEFSLFTGILLLLAASLSTALTLEVSLDQATITETTQGTAYVWAPNPFNVPTTVSFTARAAQVSAALDQPQHPIGLDATAGTVLRFWAPPGFRGVDYITVSAQACSPSGVCQTDSKRIEVRVEAPRTSTSASGQGTPSQFSKPTPAWGSVVYFSPVFDPSSYDVELQSRTACKTVTVGGQSLDRILVLNRGAAGSFSVQAIGDKALVDVDTTPDRLALRASGAEQAWLRVSPHRGAAGVRTWVTLQLLAPNGQLVSERDFCFDVQDQLEARLNVPRLTQATNCAPVTLTALLQNTGTGPDRYEISGERIQNVTPDDLDLAAGQTQVLSLTLSTSGLTPGQHPIAIRAIGLGGTLGQGTTTLDVKACEQVAQATTQPSEPAQTNVTVQVANEFNRTLSNLTARVEGLPEGWEALVPADALTLEPGQAANLTILVKAGSTDDVKNATLVLREGDQVILRQRLPALSGKPSGLTGLFVAASNSAWIVATLLIVVLLVLVMTGKLEDFKEQLGVAPVDESHREAYLAKLKSIRDQVEKGGDGGSDHDTHKHPAHAVGEDTHKHPPGAAG